MSAIVDSGFVVALVNPNDAHHAAVARAARTLRAPPWLVTPALTEIAYVLHSRAGPCAVGRFVGALNDPAVGLELLDPVPDDYRRTEQLLAKYGDSGIDFVDALIAAVAERLGVRTILTLDRRHFALFRPAHCPAFQLLPEP